MPRPARLIATMLLVFALSAIGSTAAYAHDPKPDGRASTSTHAHAKKHAHKVSPKAAHHRAVVSHSKVKGNAKAHHSVRIGTPAPASTVVTGLVGNLLGPTITQKSTAPSDSGALPITVVRQVRGPGAAGAQGSQSVAGGSSTAKGATGKSTGTRSPSQPTSATVPYQATERRQQRASALLFALIAVFGAAMVAMILGAGYRGHRNAR
jgi:hypothetical protein